MSATWSRFEIEGPAGTLSVRTLGSPEAPGLPILFVHPINLQGRAWSLVAPAFADEHFCVMPDLRGHGTSDAAGPFGTPAWAEDLMAVVDQLGLDRFHVVGGSAGGPLAVHLAAHHPDRVASITAVGSSLGRQGKGPDIVGDLLQEMDVESMFRAVIPDISLAPTCAPEIVEWTLALCNPNSSETVAAVWRSSGETDVRPIVGDVRCPAVVITGSVDATATPGVGDALAAALGTELILLDGIGHLPMLESPGLLVEHLRPHLGAARAEAVSS